jgi:hypothetical protein
MKRFLKYAALIATVLVICSSAWANTYVDHINTAPNNKGDLLIFPWFLAFDGGWQTKLTVINTDTVNSVVAKVVFRSFKNSTELLDFLIFLSPADVWTGKIYYNTASKTVKIYSDDDSILTATTPTFATPAAPVDKSLELGNLCSDDASFFGYVEIIEAAWGPVAPAAPGVKKTDIYAKYGGVGNTPVTSPLTSDTSINVLAGYMEWGNPTLGHTAGLRATAFRDYDNKGKLTTSVVTKIGAPFSSNNNLSEVEASFTKDFIAMPYANADDVAWHFFTFPTKQTDNQNGLSCKAPTNTSPYFQGRNCVPYTCTTYDLKENSPQNGSPFSGTNPTINCFPWEVNVIFASDFPYAEGWAQYIFGDLTGSKDLAGEPLAYAGAPVIPSYLYIGKSGLNANYGAWTDSYVAGVINNQAVILTDYQYTDLAVEHTTDPTKR